MKPKVKEVLCDAFAAVFIGIGCFLHGWPSLIFLLIGSFCAPFALYFTLLNHRVHNVSGCQARNWSLLLFLVFIIGGAIYWRQWRQEPEPGPSPKVADFSIKALTVFVFAVGPNDLSHMMYVHSFSSTTHQGSMSPIRMAVYIQLRNLQGIETMVDGYSVEADPGNGNWAPAELATPTYGSIVLGFDLKEMAPIGSKCMLDSELVEKNFQPGETVSGWIFFEKDWYPKIRFRVEDSSGKTSEASFDLTTIPHDSANIQMSGLMFTKPLVDITGIQITPQ